MRTMKPCVVELLSALGYGCENRTSVSQASGLIKLEESRFPWCLLLSPPFCPTATNHSSDTNIKILSKCSRLKLAKGRAGGTVAKVLAVQTGRPKFRSPPPVYKASSGNVSVTPLVVPKAL